MFNVCSYHSVDKIRVCSCVFSAATSSRFMSSSLSVNYDRFFTAKRRSLRHSKVMKLWRHVLFKTIFIGLTLYCWLGRYVNVHHAQQPQLYPFKPRIRQKSRLTSVDLHLKNVFFERGSHRRGGVIAGNAVGDVRRW